MTMDGTTSIVVTLLGVAMGFAAIVWSSGITTLDRGGRRHAVVCGTLLLIGMTTIWSASSMGFAG